MFTCTIFFFKILHMVDTIWYLSVSDFIQHDNLYVYLCCCNWHYLFLFFLRTCFKTLNFRRSVDNGSCSYSLLAEVKSHSAEPWSQTHRKHEEAGVQVVWYHTLQQNTSTVQLRSASMEDQHWSLIFYISAIQNMTIICHNISCSESDGQG